MNIARRATRWLLAACSLALLAACATGPRVTTEADPRADFSQYRTWAFYAPLAMERDGYETPASRTARAAVAAQMEQRGYRHAPENPDLWVNINAYLERRTDVTSLPTVDYGYYYSYRARGYVGVPYWSDRTEVRRYTEGTMNVDIIDRAQNRLVWEGIAVGRVGSRNTPAERDARVNAAVVEIFARFPHRAGAAGVAM